MMMCHVVVLKYLILYLVCRLSIELVINDLRSVWAARIRKEERGNGKRREKRVEFSYS
jgi:hypothetical protein